MAERIIEVIPEGERRTLFSVAAPGRAKIFESPDVQEVIEVLEVVLEPVAANTIQLLLSNRTLTPVLDLAARQTYGDPGFLMGAEDELILVTGGAGSVVGYIRWRVRREDAA